MCAVETVTGFIRFPPAETPSPGTVASTVPALRFWMNQPAASLQNR
jgi:hypothetical protein